MSPVRISYLRAPIAGIPPCTYRDREPRYHRIVKLRSPMRAFTKATLDCVIAFGYLGGSFYRSSDVHPRGSERTI